MFFQIETKTPNPKFLERKLKSKNHINITG